MGRPTLRICLKAEANRYGKHVVRLRITANRLSRYISLAAEVTPAQFNPKGKRESKNWIRTSHPNHGNYNEQIADVWDKTIAAIKEMGLDVSADALKAHVMPGEQFAIGKTDKAHCFLQYAEQYVARRPESATTDTYKNALNAFNKFCNRPTLPVSEITMLFLKRYRTWLLGHYSNNTSWLYYVRIKTIAFEAAEDLVGLSDKSFLDAFRRIKVPKVRTAKQRLYPEEIQRLADLELGWDTPLRRTRDLALLMYYAHGMRVGDALRLQQSNYVVTVSPAGELEHRLIFVMQKTGKPKNVLLPAVAVELLEPYRADCTKATDTLFSTLRRAIDAGYTPYRMSKKVTSVKVMLRRNLHRLAQMAGIEKAISPHVFRHSFADFARRSGLSITQIKNALGHENINTTQGYMEDLDQLAVDEVANLFAQRKTLGKQKPESDNDYVRETHN